MNHTKIRINGRWVYIDKPSNDLRIIKQNAAKLFHINQGLAHDQTTDTQRLNVVAVTGRFESETICFPEAVLLEIGMGRMHPYVESRIPPELHRQGEPFFFPPRVPVLTLSAGQYKAVAPLLFQYLQDKASAQVRSRAKGWDIFSVRRMGSQRLTKVVIGRRRKFAEVEFVQQKRPLVRFSASLADSFLVSDLCWAELHANRRLQSLLKGLSKIVKARLSMALGARKWAPKRWMDVPHFQVAWQEFSKLENHFHLQVHFVNNFLGKDNYFYEEFCRRIRYEPDQPVFELESERSALSGAKERLGNIEVRIRRREQKFIIFDVYPPKPALSEGEFDDGLLFGNDKATF